MLDESRLALDLPVEWTCGEDFEGDDEGRILHGHPGRIYDPSPEDIFVRWFGLEDKGASIWVSYGVKCLGEISEEEYSRRVERMQKGLPPVG
jgi:hypothetical protein